MAEFVFVLDSNVFIEAKQRYYAFDLAPRFWEILTEQAANGNILSIDRVKEELNKGKDELSEWANNQFSEAFMSTGERKVIESFREIMGWVNAHNQFLRSAKDKFAQVADGWVIAYGRATGCIVVTQEVLKPEIKRDVPIPNVCEAFAVPYIDTFEMLRRLGVRWV